LLEFQNATCRAIDLIPLLKVPTWKTKLVSYTYVYYESGMIMVCSIPMVYLHKFKKNVNLPEDAH
jgi:hypothetical protein